MGVPHIDSCVCREHKVKRNDQMDLTMIYCKGCHKHMGSAKTSPDVEKIEVYCLGCTTYTHCLDCKKPFSKPEDWGYCSDCSYDPMG